MMNLKIIKYNLYKSIFNEVNTEYSLFFNKNYNRLDQKEKNKANQIIKELPISKEFIEAFSRWTKTRAISDDMSKVFLFNKSSKYFKNESLLYFISKNYILKNNDILDLIKSDSISDFGTTIKKDSLKITIIGGQPSAENIRYKLSSSKYVNGFTFTYNGKRSIEDVLKTSPLYELMNKITTKEQIDVLLTKPDFFHQINSDTFESPFEYLVKHLTISIFNNKRAFRCWDYRPILREEESDFFQQISENDSLTNKIIPIPNNLGLVICPIGFGKSRFLHEFDYWNDPRLKQNETQREKIYIDTKKNISQTDAEFLLMYLISKIDMELLFKKTNSGGKVLTMIFNIINNGSNPEKERRIKIKILSHFPILLDAFDQTIGRRNHRRSLDPFYKRIDMMKPSDILLSSLI